MSTLLLNDTRVAVLVDCDNTSPLILDHALRMVAQLGRVVIRRGYGNHATLGHRWKDALVAMAFTPHLQYQYASGKNTADIALALDALEILFDGRADTFCLITSDSDFAYLCRKLRERGATVCIVGEVKTPPALRNASDSFFEWPGEAEHVEPSPADASTGAAPATAKTLSQEEDMHTSITSTPAFVLEAIELLTETALEGKVNVGMLGNYVKRTDPGFTPAKYGYSGLLNMLKDYGSLLELIQEEGGHYTVRLATGARIQEHRATTLTT